MNTKGKDKKTDGISFIVPAYNCEDTIEESILSIVRGNYRKGDEIIVVDDFSTDSTQSVLRKLKKIYPHITIYQNTWNRGSAVTRNIAIEHVNNNYIFCLDSDNILVRDSVRDLFKFMHNMGADSAAFQYLYFFKKDTGLITHKWKFKEGEISLADYLASYIVPGASGNYLFSKVSWIKAGGYPQCRTLDTWGFGLRQHATGSKMVVLPGTYYYHRYGHDSNWIRERRRGKSSLIALQVILPFIGILDQKDVDRIMSRKYRNVWFDNLNKEPLKLACGLRGEGGKVIDETVDKTYALSLKTRITNIGMHIWSRNERKTCIS